MASIAEMEGLNPNTIVKAIHIRFKPDSTKLDNLCGPRFKDACTLELRNIIDSVKVTVDGKEKTVTTLKPISIAVAEWKAQNGDGGSGTEQGGSSNSCPHCTRRYELHGTLNERWLPFPAATFAMVSDIGYLTLRV